MEGNREKFARGRAAMRKRGIYLFPNLLTSGALFAGFYAIVAGADGDFERAAVSLFVAMILDALDGRVARMTGTVTEFGRQYDSLSDVVAFGLGPAVVMYQWGLKYMGDYGWVWDKIGWVIAFLFAVGTALRLARFTARESTSDKNFFEGLPCPAAAGFVAGFVWLAAESQWTGLPVPDSGGVRDACGRDPDVRAYRLSQLQALRREPAAEIYPDGGDSSLLCPDCAWTRRSCCLPCSAFTWGWVRVCWRGAQ